MEKNNIAAQPQESGDERAKNTKKIVSLGLILFTVTAITGLILGVVHDITAAPIKETQIRLKNEALAAVLPGADKFSPIEVAKDSPPILKDIYEARKGSELAGYCITVTPKGYSGPIELVAGITAAGKLSSIRILNHTETPGLGAKAPLPFFSDQYKDKEVEKLEVVKTTPSAPDQIQAISGATITSDAVTKGVNDALEYWSKHLKGGE